MSECYWIDDSTSPEEAARVARRVSGDEWIEFNDHFFQSCCDCGLTHRVDIRNKTVGTREARFARLDTFTEQMRLRFKWENPACADEIERLRAEVARLTDERTRATATLRAALARAEAAEKDAARYRTWRTLWTNATAHVAAIEVIAEAATEAQLDAAVDAAIAQKEGM